MPAPSAKSGRSQLNVWIKDATAEYIKDFAKSRGFNIGSAVDKIIELHRYYTTIKTEQQKKDTENEANDHF